MHRIRASSSCCLMLAFSFVSLQGVQGGLITGLDPQVAPAGSGVRYTYSLTNEPSSDLNAIALSIDVDPAADVWDISSPTGWTVSYQPGDIWVAWESPDPQFDLLPGDTFTFGFTSRLGPGHQPYYVLGIDETESSFDFNSGLTASPTMTAVPEPDALMLSLSGVLVSFALRHWRRMTEG